MNAAEVQTKSLDLDGLFGPGWDDFLTTHAPTTDELAKEEREEQARRDRTARSRALREAGLDPFSLAVKHLRAKAAARTEPVQIDRADTFRNFEASDRANTFRNEPGLRQARSGASNETSRRASILKERSFINDLLQRFHADQVSNQTHRDGRPSALLRANSTRRHFSKSQALPKRFKPAPLWRDTSDALKVIYGGESLAVRGIAQDFTAQISDDVKAKALDRPNPCNWLATRIKRRLRDAFPDREPPDIVITSEIAEGEIGLHLHGIVGVPFGLKRVAFDAIKEALGWDPGNNNHNLRVHGEGGVRGRPWLNYMVKNFRPGLTTCFMSRALTTRAEVLFNLDRDFVNRTGGLSQ